MTRGIWPLALLALLIYGRRVAPRPPSGPTPPPRAMGLRMKIDELIQLALSVGFTGPAVNIAAAIAMAESGGNPSAIGDLGQSFGLWQINAPSHPQYDPGRLLEPAYNAQAAYAISNQGTNWNPWTTFRTGAYLQYLPIMAAAPKKGAPAR